MNWSRIRYGCRCRWSEEARERQSSQLFLLEVLRMGTATADSGIKYVAHGRVQEPGRTRPPVCRDRGQRSFDAMSVQGYGYSTAVAISGLLCGPDPSYGTGTAVLRDGRFLTRVESAVTSGACGLAVTPFLPSLLFTSDHPQPSPP